MERSGFLLVILLLCFNSRVAIGQEVVQKDPLMKSRIKISSYGIGAQSLGLSEFNRVFTSLNLKAIPELRYALFFNRFSLPEGNKLFTGFSIGTQTYFSINQNPGELSYTFSKQQVDFNVGYFLYENNFMMIPVYGGVGLNIFVFNSHTNFNNDDKDFGDILINGSGTGIYNMVELSLVGSITTGVDFKINKPKKNRKNELSRFNLGFRTGAIYSIFQSPATLEGISGIPETDRFNYYISLHLSRFLFPCN